MVKIWHEIQWGPINPDGGSTFDVSRQLAERREACLLHLLPRQRVRWLIGRGEACLLLLIVYWFIGPHCILCQILTID